MIILFSNIVDFFKSISKYLEFLTSPFLFCYDIFAYLSSISPEFKWHTETSTKILNQWLLTGTLMALNGTSSTPLLGKTVTSLALSPHPHLQNEIPHVPKGKRMLTQK